MLDNLNSECKKYYYIFLFLLAFTLNAKAIAEEMERSSHYPESKNEIKIPIYAGIDGFLVTMPDVIYFMDIEEDNCVGNDVNDDAICLHNLIISIFNKEKCIKYYYDNVVEGLKETQYIKKGSLIGYASNEESTKPKIMELYNCKR